MGSFADTLAAGDSVSLLAYSSHAVQQPDYFGGIHPTCYPDGTPLNFSTRAPWTASRGY